MPRKGHYCGGDPLEVEFSPEGKSVVFAYRHGAQCATLRITRAGLRAIAAMADRAARSDGDDEEPFTCSVKGEVIT